MLQSIDVVVGGPDGSGTSTQINWLVENFSGKYGLRVRDLRGTEVHALWHAKENPARAEALVTKGYDEFTKKVFEASTVKSTPGFTIGEFRQGLERLETLERLEKEFLRWSARKIQGTPSMEPSLAVMSDAVHGTRIDVNDADVWILEEPSYRLTGLHNRFFEQQRSAFGAPPNQKAAAMAHALYRESEYYRFRREILAAGKICLRSRSEESGCYQMYDSKLNPTGPLMQSYFDYPGHHIAFSNAPTHLFIAHGPQDWTVADMIEFAGKRLDGRLKDDYERNPEYQLLINTRYATDWLENFYREGCELFKGTAPQIIRFNMTTPKTELKELMVPKMDEILANAGYLPANKK